MNIRFENRDYANEQLLKCILRVIQETELCSLATTNVNGKSHINTLFFCFDNNLDIYFVSDWRTRHCTNIAKKPASAVAIFNSHQRWGGSLRGIQLFGKCFAAGSDESKKAEIIYGSRFPGYKKYRKRLSEKERRESPHRFFVFRPKKVKVFDEDILGEENFVLAKVMKERNG